MTIDIVIAGWSKERAKPEAYLMRTSDQVFGISPEEARKAVEAGDGYLPEQYKLHAFGNVAWGPNLGREQRELGGIYGITAADLDEPELLDYMRTVLELQRREFHQPEEGTSFSIVGGFGLATTVTADGVAQKIFHRWPEDRAGERIVPKQIDWAAWRAQHTYGQTASSVTPLIPQGLNRQQRRALERQAKKGAA